MAYEDGVTNDLLMMTQDWTASLPHWQQQPACFLLQDPLAPERGRPKGVDVTMSSPDPSQDPFAFDLDEQQWDPYDDSSHTQLGSRLEGAGGSGGAWA
jgi:hypothetical protein